MLKIEGKKITEEKINERIQKKKKKEKKINKLIKEET